MEWIVYILAFLASLIILGIFALQVLHEVAEYHERAGDRAPVTGCHQGTCPSLQNGEAIFAIKPTRRKTKDPRQKDNCSSYDNHGSQ